MVPSTGLAMAWNPALSWVRRAGITTTWTQRPDWRRVHAAEWPHVRAGLGLSAKTCPRPSQTADGRTRRRTPTQHQGRYLSRPHGSPRRGAPDARGADRSIPARSDPHPPLTTPPPSAAAATTPPPRPGPRPRTDQRSIAPPPGRRRPCQSQVRSPHPAARLGRRLRTHRRHARPWLRCRNREFAVTPPRRSIAAQRRQPQAARLLPGAAAQRPSL